MALKLTTEIREDHQALLTLELEPADLERAKRRVARQLSQRLRIPGFRPGKAPYEVVALHVGEEAILEEAIEALLDEFYPQALKEAQIEPYGPGQVQEHSLEGNPTFKVLVPLKPEVELGDYRALRVPYEPPQVSDEEVTEALERLREQHAILEPVERPAEEGDLVYAKLRGEGQRPVEGQEEPAPVNIPEREAPFVILAQAEADEWPYPGFSRELIGLKPGDEKTLTYTYPEDYEDEDLRGATVTYTVTVTAVKSRTLPELDDEFAQTLGLESLEELRQRVREDLERSNQDEYDREYLRKVMDALLEQSQFKYPPQAVEDTLENMIGQIKAQAASMGLTWEQYLRFSQTTEEELRESMRDSADQATRWELALREVAEREDIEASADSIQEEVQQRLLNLMYTMDPKRFRRLLRDRDYLTRVYLASAEDVILRQAEEFLLRIAKGELEAEEPEADAAHGADEATPEPEPAPEVQPQVDPEGEAPAPEAESSPEEPAA